MLSRCGRFERSIFDIEWSIIIANITLYKSKTLLCGIDNIAQNILGYSVEYCQSRKTLLWIWIMLWTFTFALDIERLDLRARKGWPTLVTFCFIGWPNKHVKNPLVDTYIGLAPICYLSKWTHDTLQTYDNAKIITSNRPSSYALYV